ncbi:hypothetical protein [Kitasatospora viridis]|uniref:Uncharacterized protein n=1 Tax=Kitasatospora viridis TaxID=281105 RepID=A0A561S9B6_9ACTN|nr:hypothetical protein [Kitasatospora viridis]TWF71469.1 hypothetical protein FHX73_1999 [Kitasatospora viridis]
MTIFHCSACGAALTGTLQLLPAVPPRHVFDGVLVDGRRQAPPTVPRGGYAVDPEPHGPPFVPAPDQDGFPPAYPGGPCTSDVDGVIVISAGPRNTFVLHPEDAPDLTWHATPDGPPGCCGAPGDGPPNQACRCGVVVGSVMSDCFTPYELHLLPDAVRAAPAP